MADEIATPPSDAGAPAGDAATEWDGADWSALDKHPWWKAVPESARGHITKAHEERTAAKTRSDYLDRLFTADDDSVRRDLETTQKEREEIRKERDSLKESLAGIEARSAEESSEREFTRLEAKFPDIFADHHADPEKPGELLPKGAYVKFVKLLQAGETEDDAALMARAVMVNKRAVAADAKTEPAAAPQAKVRDVKPPPSIAQAGKGGNNPSTATNAKEANETIDQRLRRVRREAEEEDARKGISG